MILIIIYSLKTQTRTYHMPGFKKNKNLKSKLGFAQCLYLTNTFSMV
jgi:hypothetical protein